MCVAAVADVYCRECRFLLCRVLRLFYLPINRKTVLQRSKMAGEPTTAGYAIVYCLASAEKSIHLNEHGSCKMERNSFLERYHLLAVRPKEFVIVCVPLIRAEKLGTIIQSALDIATLEKQKEDLEQSPMVYLSYGEERLGASCRRRLVFSGTSETVDRKLEAAEQAEASSAEAAPSTSVQEREHRSAVLAHVIIDEKRSLVRVQVNSSLHKGVHNFTIEELDDHRFGAAIIKNEYKVAIHNCDSLPDSANGREHATLFTVLRKRGTNVATLKIRHCARAGIYEGEDCLVNESDSFYSALLRFKKPLDECRAGVQKKMQKGKGHCCVYCKQFFVEIASHLKRMHSAEEEVQSALQLPVNSKRRNHAFSILRLKGDDSFNKTAPIYDRISMRKTSISSKGNLLRCYNCQAWLSKRNFARHERKCTSRLSNHQQVADKARKLGGAHEVQNGQHVVNDEGEILRSFNFSPPTGRDLLRNFPTLFHRASCPAVRYKTPRKCSNTEERQGIIPQANGLNYCGQGPRSYHQLL